MTYAVVPVRLTRHSQSDPMTAAHRTTLLLTLFALAMTHVEASLVVHLHPSAIRTMR